MTEIRIAPTGATLGAVVTGVELGSLKDDDWSAIETAFHAHAVLIFPAQHLSESEQAAFARRFGEIEHLAGRLDTVQLTNQKSDGSFLAEDDHFMQVLIGNEGWHTDSSYMPLAAKASVLSAHVIPSSGGQTEWADMRAAYDALDDDVMQRIDKLAAFHSLLYSQAKIGHRGKVGASYGFTDAVPPLRPLVKTHPVTGRRSLYIGRHAYGIPGLDPSESERLLADLVAFACQPPRVYQHEWRAGDVAVWDNRCVLHRARPYDHREPRVMKHTRVAGDPSTELGMVSDAAPPVPVESP